MATGLHGSARTTPPREFEPSSKRRKSRRAPLPPATD